MKAQVFDLGFFCVQIFNYVIIILKFILNNNYVRGSFIRYKKLGGRRPAT